MITIEVRGIEDALATLENAQNVETPVMEGIKEVMEKAQELVEAAYESQWEGNTDFSIKLTEIEHGYVLTASGEDVGFLEFGAGWGVMPDEFASEVDYDVPMGSYSIENMGQFAETGLRYWYYEGERYTYIDPTRGMQIALDYVRDNLARVVSEKIRKWIGN